MSQFKTSPPSTSLRLRIAFPSKFRISNLAQILLPSSLSSFSHHHPQNKPHLRLRRHWRPRRRVNLVLHRTPHKTRRIRCDSSLHRREATLTLSTRSIPARITCNARRTSTAIRYRPGPVPRVVCGCQRRDDGGDRGVTCSARFVAAAVALRAALLGRVLREGWRVGPISLDPGFVTYATSCGKSTNGRRISLSGSGIVFTAPSSSRWFGMCRGWSLGLVQTGIRRESCMDSLTASDRGIAENSSCAPAISTVFTREHAKLANASTRNYCHRYISLTNNTANQRATESSPCSTNSPIRADS